MRRKSLESYLSSDTKLFLLQIYRWAVKLSRKHSFFLWKEIIIMMVIGTGLSNSKNPTPKVVVDWVSWVIKSLIRKEIAPICNMYLRDWVMVMCVYVHVFVCVRLDYHIANVHHLPLDHSGRCHWCWVL